MSDRAFMLARCNKNKFQVSITYIKTIPLPLILMADYFMLKLLRRIFGITVFGITASCVTIYGIMQCLQTIYCRFGEFCVETCDNILMIKLVCVHNKIEYMNWDSPMG